jgi:hypothetical protein
VRRRFLKLILLCLLTIAALPATAIPDPAAAIRFSLITCGPGEEIYSVFGHTAIRVVDSTTGTDLVYNYGTFDGYEDNFELKFMRGKLLYYLSCERFDEFMELYASDGRWVQEQELLLNDREKMNIYAALRTNYLPENRAYKYDFFFDNCATRIRDIIPKGLGDGFQYPNVLPGNKISFRTIVNHYLYREHWTRLGINILLGTKVDAAMSNSDIMFLPDYLRDGVAGATLKGRKIATAPASLLEAKAATPAGPNGALLTLLAFGGLCIICGLTPALRIPANFLFAAVLVITGLLGILILVMWFGTDHQACGPNLNILWALPTNLLLPFLRKKRRYVYAVIALVLMAISFLLHLLHIQCLPLPELAPILAVLVFIFGKMILEYQKASDHGKKKSAA